jgi:uncharacterized protein YciI
MSPRLLLPGLLVTCLGFTAALAKDKPAPTMVLTHHTSAASADPDLTTYYFGLITKGPNFNAYDQEGRAKIQALHLANIQRLAALGKLLIAGPFPDNGDWRGIFIFKCASLEEAQALVATDPAVQTGRLRVELHAWTAEKGSIRDPEFPR